MRIDSSSIILSAESQFTSKTVTQETLKVWNNNISEGSNQNQQELTQEFVKPVTYEKPKPITQKEEELLFELSDEDKQKIRLIESMLKWFTGKEVKLNTLESIRVRKNSENQMNLAFQNSGIRNGFGLHYTYSEQKIEQEDFSFKAIGQVKTQDNREIKFDFKINFNRTLVESRFTEIKMGEALVDPLVINFDADIPSIHNKTIRFDIDSDNKLDNLPFFRNAGYLAFDKNKDGIINDGTELFGPATQNGFAELANYDSDENGWIDENDEVFNNLVVWTMDENGNNQLLSLIKADVGAIYLGNVDTNLRLLDNQNEMAGKMSEAGIYLKESGGVGAVSHVDVKL